MLISYGDHHKLNHLTPIIVSFVDEYSLNTLYKYYTQLTPVELFAKVA